VLSVVSMSPHKNVATAIDAFSLARARHQLPHELRLIGMPGIDPSPGTSAISRAAAAGVPIRYLGFVDDRELASAYVGASLFVFLSRVEGFGLPPLEAMSAGVPVVASNTSSLPEVCGDAAIAVSPDDVEAAAAAIGHVLTHPDTAARLSAAGRRRVERFSWLETARLTREVYLKAVGRPETARLGRR
jgi:glycosyltransferase involved in cell wall biosynthesis